MELAILHGIQNVRFSFLDTIMVFISAMGNAGIMWVVIGIVLCCIRKFRRCGIMVLVSLLLSLIIGNVILKNVIARPRPCWIDSSIPMLINIPNDYSFPSGHTMSSFAAAAAIYFKDRKLGIPLLVVAAVMGFSRMYLFVHYLSDVLAGMIIGILIAYIVKKSFDKLDSRKAES